MLPREKSINIPTTLNQVHETFRLLLNDNEVEENTFSTFLVLNGNLR